MKIAVDLRSLSSGSISGVENYCLNLLERLLALDRKNQYILFYNSFSSSEEPSFHFVNSKVRHTHWPSKVLNLSLKLKAVSLEKLIGEFDLLFMPNLNQFNIGGDKKLAITVHDLSPIITPEFYDVKRRVWHKFLSYKKAFQRAQVLFAVSEYTKKDLIRIFNIAPEKIKVTYPGVDHSVFHSQIAESELRQVRNLYGLPSEFILFLNTIEPRKNLAGLIRAFESCHSSAQFIIAGRLGWKYANDFALIKNSKKSAKIKYIGYVDEKYKAALIKLAKVLVYPSFYEGFGFQALEAMAVGTPVIASQLTSLPEVVSDAGLLVNPYSADDLSLTLDQVLENKDLSQKLAEKGHERAKQFNWQKTAEIILNNLQ